MFSIGEFAKYGRVSIRMLRHYDAIGLLPPAHVDRSTGYRHYEAGQLARLNRIIALKDLGLSLQQVAAILDERVGVEEMRGMLRLRRAELEQVISDTAARLTRVEARLKTIEGEGRTPGADVVVKNLPPVRLAEVTGTAASFDPQDVGPVIDPLFAGLCHRLNAAGVTPVGPALARYRDAPDGGGAVVVHAGLPVAAEVRRVDDGVAVVDVPGVDLAATIVHRGSMNDVLPTSQALARWIDANGYRSTGYARELSLATPEDTSQWVIELQEPIVSI
ncbi:MerR family transcriptional regulator [Sinosporangium siamense]|uniref:MerR family transcriptional regulator n=1 Tax=Sinosporangium siamense TaxID=1367973 RepID=A0A919VA92_9ACTN|nr:MerR family transcriptional regulator [Sinosporangium siamense]GII96211.1 MerR family transcriptional regulator [Sinosporangium siamense]